VTLRDHVSRHGVPHGDRRLIELVERSGLRGRGGAGFPAGRKLRAVAERRGRAVVVANGTEGEPVSAKDKVLLRGLPHLVLDGAALAAAAVGAREAIVAVARTSRHELAAVQAALAEREAHRLDPVELRVVSVPERFVAGEETALVQALDGGVGLPTFVPPRPFERGVGGAPTLVQNVETLAQIALIARYGAEWFRELGTAEEPGSALVTLSGAVREPAVYEVALGVPLQSVLDAAGGPTAPPQAVLVGGYFGTWVEAARLSGLRLSDAGLSDVGASLGARALAVVPQGVCGLVEVARVSRWLADESAGQCGPCVVGLDAVAGGVSKLVKSGGRGGVTEQLHRWLSQIEGRGACRHPDGAVRFVRSALRVFAAEIALHERGRCSAAQRDVHVLPLPRR
jgi:NADH:ubiquinone oxidoreductase subunit F (NADH-binding)